MMSEFFRPTLPLKEIKRASPSRVQSLKLCILRESWASQKLPSLLPSSALANLGNAIHDLLEDAGEGLIRVREGISERFDQRVAEEESKLASAICSRHLLPLKKYVRDFEVRKIQAIQRANEVWMPPPDRPSGSGEKKFERWLQSKDNKIGGFVDHIREDGEKVTIRDFKTGSIFGDDDKTIKPEYVTQLALYCVLYEQKNEIWPSRMELVPLSGCPVTVPISREEALSEYKRALDVLESANQKISDAMKDPDSKVQQSGLALLGSHCRFCQYRPACHRYMDSQKSGGLEESSDLAGSVEKTYTFGNGQLGLKIRVGSDSILVKGLSPSPRHPHLELCQPGVQVGVFNLSGIHKTLSRSESMYTTIYAYSAERIRS